MGCIKCHRMTAANFGTTFTCNHCNEKQQASPRKAISACNSLLYVNVEVFLKTNILSNLNSSFITCRCRFDIDLTDHTDTLTASVFDDLAETLLTFTALKAMNYHEEVGYISIKKP